MSPKKAPKRVWVSWCALCDKADCVYIKHPKSKDTPECPWCESHIGQAMLEYQLMVKS